MEIRKVPISLLNAAPYNPRKDLQPGDPEYQKIARSIEKYGCVEPIIWNEKTGNVIGGHQRLKVLGVREAWYFRERMKKLLDNPQINVFHFEDGMRGLDSMIDFSDYIALSIPELRIIKPKTFREDTRYLTHYIKNRKPEIDIHLLGCTDVKMIAQNSFCTSADSTSWLSGVKYGWFDDGNQKAHINQFRKDLIEQRLSAVRTVTEGRGLDLTDKTLLYGARASLCATICKQKYTRAAGSQE